ncbi:11477_t:CDS:2 [Funneliformis geosporum]|uniref:2534_t:CDS:1 n=1 Tax=Funneliformis geosporum TaxID=1117311 RepID=A0A9W4SHM7_9GLOM|nr:2534_t:CDS:2 [Funneliformis geosporum]CAI2171199.1 11477_t:CDS:2 [Funneliformis geosporum]
MPPNPSKTTPPEILSLCKKFFYIGFLFLPWLWVVNVIYMWPLTKRSDIDLYFSMAGALFWFIALSTWYGIFVNQRIAWGEFSDKIIVIPLRGK